MKVTWLVGEPCVVPLCTYPKHGREEWPFCAPCMSATVRRLLHYHGIWHMSRTDMPKDPWVLEKMHSMIKFVQDNADNLVMAERQSLRSGMKPVSESDNDIRELQ